MNREIRRSIASVLVTSSVACSSGSHDDGKGATTTGATGGVASFSTGGTGYSGVPGSTGGGGTPNAPSSGGAGVLPQGAGGTTYPPLGAGGSGVSPLGAGGAEAPPFGAGGALVGAGGAPMPGSGGAGPVTPGGTTCLKAGTGDFSKVGPYAVATEVVDLGPDIDPTQGTGEFTIFYPRTFEDNCPHPIIAWGNGTTVVGPEVYAFFNQNAASWGIVAIAAHDSNTGSGSYHRKGLDYLLAQNADPSSKFYQKLSPKAGVTGHSQGGFGAQRASSHPNVKALVPVGASGTAASHLGFLCLTGTADIAPASCRTAVQAAQGPALAAIWEGGDHVVTETLAGYISGNPGTIQMMRLYTAWFRCFLADDGVACALFDGAPNTCGICQDTGWAELVAKNL